jgi:peptide-methionine (R)-S-oxide reductase
MKKYNIKVILLLIIIIIFNCKKNQKEDSITQKEKYMSFEISKTDKEWKDILSKEQYKVLREHGTERAFSGKYHDNKEKGKYLCAGCGNYLFVSETKFDSGTGWPSFYEPAEPNSIGTKADRSFFMVRTEVHCSKCGGHLGHVFKDGPVPTGLRYCINSVSLAFKPD